MFYLYLKGSIERMQNKLIIVGDKISDHLENKNVIGISDFIFKVESGRKAGSKDVCFSVGQGLSSDKRDKLKSMYDSNLVSFDASVTKYLGLKKASSSITHKIHDFNVLISDPCEVDEDKFISQLMVDEASDQLADHLSGSHLSAMVITEAARQMNIAVSEKFLKKESDKKFNFVLLGLKVNFYEYIYPFSASIELHVDAVKKSGDACSQINVTVFFIQGAVKCAEVSSRFMIVDKRIIEGIENEKFDETLKKLT